MTNTLTEDSKATADQIMELYDNGSESGTQTMKSAENIIKSGIYYFKSNYNIPLIGDFTIMAHTAK